MVERNIRATAAVGTMPACHRQDMATPDGRAAPDDISRAHRRQWSAVGMSFGTQESIDGRMAVLRARRRTGGA